MRFVSIGLFFVGIVTSFVITGCTRKPPEMPPPKAPEVMVSVPVKMTIVDFEEFTGRTDAKEAIELKARVKGDIVKVNFVDGAMVQKGDVLFEIEPKQFQAELQQAKAVLNQSQVRFKRLSADFQRAAGLMATKSISIEEFEKIKGDREEAEAAVGANKEAVVLKQQNYDYTKVVAPITGRTSRRFKDPGNLVMPDDMVLTTIVSVDPMYVYFDVDERTVLRLRSLVQRGKIKAVQEMEFEFALANEEGYPHKGKINFENNKIDPSTGTLQLRGEFANPDNIAPGLFARVRLLLGEPHEALLVAERALSTDQGQKYLYVVNEENKAVYRGLERENLGALIDGMRVIDKGVNPGERVIVSGLQRVRQNIQVDPKLVPMPGFAAAKDKK
ncbi:MAG: efflux RND transporter periplasmic adaptor subunit [Planctomycetes bacterium]|nr:efflux RND transporter periplasmic adaptor subunit [Planctomycetota bacterium]